MWEATVGIDLSHTCFVFDSFIPVLEDFDYGFAENGLTAYKLGTQLSSQSFIKYIGEERYKTLVNFILHYIADLDIPLKRCFDPCAYLYVINLNSKRNIRRIQKRDDQRQPCWQERQVRIDPSSSKSIHQIA